MEIYLDNAATTRVCPEAADAAYKVMTEVYGNPGSTHKLGREARAVLDDSRKKLAAALGCAPKEVYFTSGGTESDNWAILEGAYLQRRVGRHIISSAVEHDAVRKPLERLAREGYEVTLLSPDSTGAISADAVREALKGVKATVRMKDGKTTAESEITWTEVPAAADTYGNGVVAKGVTVNGNLPVEVIVTSTTTINKVAEVPQIKVERDAKADTVTGQLPKKVAVTYSDGHTDEAAVTWNTDGLDKHLATVGEYTIEGSVEGTTLKATCKLVVETPASEIPVRPATFAPVEVFEASSAADVLKALPKKVSVMMKDDSQEDYDVDWENVPALDWGADDVTVDGKVRGTDLTVSCMVRVKPRPAAKGLVIVDQNGKATTSETVLKVERGKEIDLAAAASNAADGALLRGNVTWTSSDPTIATVENGKVKALKNGTVVVTATMPVDGDAAAIATLAEDGAAETPAPQQLTASVTVEVVEPVVVQEPTGGKDNGAKPDAKDPSGKKNGKKAAKGSLAETGDNTAVTVAALGGTGLLALIAAAIEKLRHRAE